jgi:TAG lipase/lysophosphatidylethanolamine acyltransferase
MFEPFRYLWKTISQEITDQFIIIREITSFYNDEIKERMETREKMATIKSFMGKAQTYQSWKTLSEQYDQLGVVQQQINEVYSPYYDYEYVQELMRHMVKAREEGDALKLIEIIRSHSDRNIGNMNCAFLYRHAYNHSTRLI